MAHTHSFRNQPAIAKTIPRTIIGFGIMVTVLYLLLGPVGFLYALGLGILFLVAYLLTTAFAALLDPDVY